MYDSPAGHAVRANLRALADLTEPPSAAVRESLKLRVFAAVDELKAMGWPIEKIIVRMKELTDEVGLKPFPGNPAPSRDAVVRDVVRWCIERYFGNG
jgi:hypothetical protein